MKLQGSSMFDEGGLSELMIRELPAGVYLVRIATGAEKRLIKIVKQ